MSKPETITCRLCSAASHKIFTKQALGRHSVDYFRCSGCQSIQSEEPYWLDEAYSIPGVHIDVGCASRTLKNWTSVSTLLAHLSFPRDAVALDFGAASGLFGRLMRDVGYNFYSYDKYARPAFTSYHSTDDPTSAQPQLITAFEVFEHFPNPKDELDRLFALQSPLILFTTWFCDDQGEDWVYFVEECGQHVFFYSQQAMRDIAARHGYELRSTAFFHILSLTRAITPAQEQVLTDFQFNGEAMARAQNAALVESVWQGNAHIDSDFEAARQRFIAERLLEAEAKASKR